jgi:hypothetical protein
MTVLRSVLMKPEHLEWAPRLHAAVERAVDSARSRSAHGTTN